jgi:hypothetical protein
LSPLKELDKLSLKSIGEYIKIITSLGEAGELKEENHLFHSHLYGDFSFTQEQNNS